MSFGLYPSARGIESGVRLGLMIDERNDRKADRETAKEDRDLARSLQTMNLNRLMDDEFRRESLNRLNAAQHAVESLNQRIAAGERPAPNEVERVRQVYSDSINYSMGDFINQNAKPGTRKLFESWIPTDHNTMVPRLRIESEDGSSYMAPMTPNRSEDDQTVMEFPMEDVEELIPWLQGVIGEIEQSRIKQGDTGPIEAGRASRSAHAERMARREDKQWEWENKPGQESADWAITSLGNGRFVMYNKRTGERRAPTEQEMAQFGAGDQSGMKDSDRRAQYRLAIERLMPSNDVAMMNIIRDYQRQHGEEEGLSRWAQEYADFPSYDQWVRQNYGVDIYTGERDPNWRSPLAPQPERDPARTARAQEGAGLMWPGARDDGLGVGEARRSAPQAAPQAAPPVAVNPQTGERLILQNGQWVPMMSGTVNR